MKTLINIVALAAVLVLGSCASFSSHITDYLSGFQPPSASSQQPPQSAQPLVAGLVLALPETEIGKPTTPSPAVLEKAAVRIQKELQQSPHIVIQKIFLPITIPASGLAGLSLERIRDITKEAKLTHVVVVVATSQSARKLRFWPIMENQLFVRMDGALVDVSQGRVLMTEFGQDDYVMAEALDYVNRISYPRIYYRTFTFGGPFTIVEGDPYQALGWETFRGAADQIGMKLRQRLSPDAMS
jgi:hypothetical protein